MKVNSLMFIQRFRAMIWRCCIQRDSSSLACGVGSTRFASTSNMFRFWSDKVCIDQAAFVAWQSVHRPETSFAASWFQCACVLQSSGIWSFTSSLTWWVWFVAASSAVFLASCRSFSFVSARVLAYPRVWRWPTRVTNGFASFVGSVRVTHFLFGG